MAQPRGERATASAGPSELVALWGRLDPPQRARLLELAREMVKSPQPTDRTAGPFLPPPSRSRFPVFVAILLAIGVGLYALRSTGHLPVLDTLHAKIAEVREAIESWSRETAAPPAPVVVPPPPARPPVAPSPVAPPPQIVPPQIIPPPAVQPPLPPQKRPQWQ